ncbi:hypothetical protein J132_09168 [Termitomyces sp. J132]|nr:hypothetical protein J132_09168 [Termitomyces sp. J132]
MIFQTPFGTLCLVTLLMGWTNSVPIFHNDITFILQPEFFELLNRVLQQMKYCGGTFSGHKLVLCAPTFKILGHVCTPSSQIPDKSCLALMEQWGPCKSLLESNGIVEWLHFDVCQALFKVVDSDQSSHVLSAHRLSAIRFETEHAAMIRDYNFKAGDLVLMRNTRIEVTHNKKMKPHYLGPLVVISHNHGGAYIICELDGSVLHCPVATFCLVPYFAREHITVPSNTFDINTSQLRELEQTELVNNDNTGNVTSEEENYLSLSLSNLS